ncbi:MAG: hypothetical protein WEG56_02300 [Chloroflexota bacterium]
MRRSRAAVATAILTILALLPLAVAPVAAGSGSDRAERAERARVMAYWTAERVANAKPRDFVRSANGTFSPKAKPSNPGKPGGGGGGSTGAVTGASWTKGGAINARSGKVLFTMGGSQYVCSAAVVADTRTSNSLVVTAAHCAYDEVAKQHASNWMFVPDFDASPTFTCGSTKYGCWTAVGLVVHNGYATAGGFNTQATVHDYAVAIVAGGGKTTTSTQQLDSTVGGAFAIGYPAASTGDRIYAFGYPAAGKYKGKDLVYCAGNTFNDTNNSNLTWGIACNMTGGSSGGPWLASFTESTGIGTLTSLNSYGYSGLSNMYGPKFDSKTQAVWTLANSSTSNGIATGG